MPEMKLLQNLSEVPKSEQLRFINSFDHVLCDIDGVIWYMDQPLPGAAECTESLKQTGKHVHYVTNGSVSTAKSLQAKMAELGFITNVEDIGLPVLAMISYLKKIGFNKKLYLIGMIEERKMLQEAGFLVVSEPEPADETVSSVIANIGDNENIGCVIIDIDFNLNYVKLQKCVTYLRRKDCLFIAGPEDARMVTGSRGALIGPYYFLKPVMDLTGRQPLVIAKPSLTYNEFLAEKFNLTDPTRTLFIGDSIPQDMKFAEKCGYQKLLVLTGVAKKEDLANWTYPENYKPQYYVESLGALNEILRAHNIRI